MKIAKKLRFHAVPPPSFEFFEAKKRGNAPAASGANFGSLKLTRQYKTIFTQKHVKSGRYYQFQPDFLSFLPIFCAKSTHFTCISEKNLRYCRNLNRRNAGLATAGMPCPEMRGSEPPGSQPQG